MKMRVTTHNGRAGKDGAYSVKHNDRKFDTENSEHIDSSLTSQNHEWKFDTETIGESSSFEEHEQKFYEYYFSSALEQRNDRARQSRHMERVQTMEQYRKNKRACPEETILQIGCAGNTVDASVLKAVCEEYMQWHMETYPNVKLLDAALHVDEPNAAPHLHLRRVWTVADSEGNLSVSQSKALEQLGIERPNPQKKRDRYNNPKVVFTQQCRDKFIEICERYGIAVEHTPLEPSKSGLSHDEYIRQQEQAKTEQARAELAKLQEETKPFMEMEITTQSVTDNAKVKTGLFSRKTTVTLPQEDYDILLQQAKTYILNKDRIDNLEKQQLRIQRMQAELVTKQSQAEAKRYEYETELAELERRMDKVEQKKKRLNELYTKQQRLNKIAEQLEEELKQTQKQLSRATKKNSQYETQIQDIREQAFVAIEQLKQNHQTEIREMQETARQQTEKEIAEKDKKITMLQRDMEDTKELRNRFFAVLTTLRHFEKENPNFTDEQRTFLKALEEYSLEKFGKLADRAREELERYDKKPNFPDSFTRTLDELKKRLEQERSEQEQQEHISYGGMRRR
ncbi:MAG: plasmid recombination protein [Lachnospiraceae bacterium]|nr:plasmid recombination protein [Lachnospiraceae bacterium]